MAAGGGRARTGNYGDKASGTTRRQSDTALPGRCRHRAPAYVGSLELRGYVRTLRTKGYSDDGAFKGATNSTTRNTKICCKIVCICSTPECPLVPLLHAHTPDSLDSNMAHENGRTELEEIFALAAHCLNMKLEAGPTKGLSMEEALKFTRESFFTIARQVNQTTASKSRQPLVSSFGQERSFKKYYRT